VFRGCLYLQPLEKWAFRGACPQVFSHKEQEMQKKNGRFAGPVPKFSKDIRHENVIQDRNIRHENVIGVDIIRHENVIHHCILGNIFAIIPVPKDNYAERLFRADCAMERQAE